MWKLTWSNIRFFLRMAPFKMLRRVTKSSECFPHNRFPALSQVHGSCHSSATSSPWIFSSQTWSDKVYWQIKTNKSICAEFHITPIYIFFLWPLNGLLPLASFPLHNWGILIRFLARSDLGQAIKVLLVKFRLLLNLGLAWRLWENGKVY